MMTESWEQRFGGIARLYGRKDAERLAAARMAVVGIGGVGSWVAEALVRTGVGHVILMDLDDLCITNTNRQIHALDGTVGRSKTAVMAERLRLINPEIEVVEVPAFYTVSKPERLFGEKPGLVIDAIDAMKPKAHLIATCHAEGVPVVTCGGAGGRIDPSQVKLADLARTHGDNLLSTLRKMLRREYGLPLEDKAPEIGIPCVFSPEKPRYPQCDGGTACTRDPGFTGRMACDSGFGSATHITGSFGFLAAGAAVNLYLSSKQDQ